jgi:type VI secretion system protein ImpL
VAEDNREIGLDSHNGQLQTPEQISTQMRHSYTQNYIQHWQSTLQNLKIAQFTSLKEAIGELTLLTSDNSPLTKLLNIINDNTANIEDDDVNVAKQFNALNAFIDGSSDKAKYRDVVKALAQVRDYLTSINQAADPQVASFNAAKDYMKGNLKNPIRQLTLLANQAPKPAQRWLNTLADNCWSLILNGALAHINAAWSTQVMPEYRQNIRGRYPLNRHAGAQVSIDSFTHFFGPNGTLATFFNQYLKPFVNTNLTHWKTYILNGHGLDLPAHEIALLQRAATIRQIYFANGSSTPKIAFSVKPRTLANSARAIELVVGNHTLVYQHGPQKPVNINWPLPENAAEAKIILSDFNGNRAVRSSYGPWAWFKLLDSTHLRTSRRSGNIVFDLVLGHHRASYTIISSSSLSTFTLNAIHGLDLPAKL